MLTKKFLLPYKPQPAIQDLSPITVAVENDDLTDLNEIDTSIIEDPDTVTFVTAYIHKEEYKFFENAFTKPIESKPNLFITETQPELTDFALCWDFFVDNKEYLEKIEQARQERFVKTRRPQLIQEMLMLEDRTTEPIQVDTSLIIFMGSVLGDIDFWREPIWPIFWHKLPENKLVPLWEIITNLSNFLLNFNLTYYEFNIHILANLYTIPLLYIRKKAFLRKRKWKRFRRLRRLIYILKPRRIKLRSINQVFTLSNIATSIRDDFFSTPLIHRIPITRRLMEEEYTEFFYKLNKDEVEELYIPDAFLEDNIFEDVEDDEPFLHIYLRDYDQKPYWKLRIARTLHWKIFFNKTLRAQRYTNFSKIYLKKYQKINTVLLQYVSYFSLFQCSWTRLSLLKTFLKKIVVTTENNIVFTPLFFANYFNWKFFKKKNFRNRKKIGKWSFLNFKRYICPWLTKKKNFPSRLKHLRPHFTQFNYNSQFDPLTGYIVLFDKFTNYTVPAIDYFKINALIKLHTYRYNAD